VTCIAFDSTGAIFVGTYGSGIFRSRDSGKTWLSLDSAFSVTGASGMMSDIAVSNDGHIYSASDAGISSSGDEGDTWSLLSPPSQSRLLVSSTNILFGTSSNQGLSRWDAASEKWISVLKNALNPYFTPSGQLFAFANDTLFSSLDDGASWLPELNSGIYSLLAFDRYGNPFMLTDSGALGFDRTKGIWQRYSTQYIISSIRLFTNDRSGNFFAIFQTPDRKYGLFKSRNDCEIWDTLYLWDSTSGLALNNLTIAPSGNYYAVSESLGLRRSMDGGIHWNDAQQGISIPSAQVMEIVTTRNQNVLAAMEFQGYLTSDQGETWVALDSAMAESFTTLAITRSGNILRGTSSGIYISSDGYTWFPSFPMQSLIIYSFASSVQTPIFAATDGYGLLRSTDDGSHWQHLASSPSSYLSEVAVAPNGFVYIISFDEELLRSKDQGNSWSNVTPQGSTVGAIGFTRTGEILASSMDGLFRSTDNADSWSLANSTVICSKFTMNPQGKMFAATDRGVIASDDDGTSWSRINSGLPNAPISALACDSSGRLYAGTNGVYGIYRSRNSTIDKVTDTYLLSPSSVLLSQNSPKPLSPIHHNFLHPPRAILYLPRALRCHWPRSSCACKWVFCGWRARGSFRAWDASRRHLFLPAGDEWLRADTGNGHRTLRAVLYGGALGPHPRAPTRKNLSPRNVAEGTQ
jgi:photosystem II stability/assembly factor-like uncharacterized protein